MYNDIVEDANKLNKLKPEESKEKMLSIFKQLEEIFMWYKADEEVDDDETDDETNYETDMPELESEESAGHRREQERQGLKILAPKQIIIRVPILLA